MRMLDQDCLSRKGVDVVRYQQVLGTNQVCEMYYNLRLTDQSQKKVL